MDFNDIKVRIDKPYPEITCASDSPMTVGILKNLAFSRASELSAILQYIYQSVIADKSMSEVADILEEIGIVEMTHMDMLMHAIVDFGGLPKYEDAQGYTFNANCVYTGTKLKDMLDQNINGEKYAIEQYREAMKRVKNESLIALFARIIEDEERHIEIFKKLRDGIHFLSI